MEAKHFCPIFSEDKLNSCQRRLKTNRVRFKLSQDDLARMTGISQSVISRLEKGELDLTIPQWAAIRYAFGLQLNRT